jgi:hypothetical protein
MNILGWKRAWSGLATTTVCLDVPNNANKADILWSGRLVSNSTKAVKLLSKFEC